MNRKDRLESIKNWLKSCKQEVMLGKKLQPETFDEILKEVEELYKVRNNVLPMTVSQLFRTLVDYIDDGKGNCEIYYRDCAVCSCKLRAVYPTETGTFEPYEEFVLSDEEEEE